jgi:membrane associated rhomboid family serine protease
MLTPQAIEKPWQFITAIFLHGSVTHLIYNLFALIFFGFITERLIGSKKFIILYLGSGILANLISFIIYPNQSALGASGAIMALIGIVAILKPMMTVWAFGIIMPMFILAIVWIAGSILGIFGLGDQTIGYLAHLTGILMGVIYGIYLRIRKREEKNSLRSNALSFKTKIILPEDSMRRWENYYLK